MNSSEFKTKNLTSFPLLSNPNDARHVARMMDDGLETILHKFTEDALASVPLGQNPYETLSVNNFIRFCRNAKEYIRLRDSEEE